MKRHIWLSQIGYDAGVGPEDIHLCMHVPRLHPAEEYSLGNLSFCFGEVALLHGVEVVLENPGLVSHQAGPGQKGYSGRGEGRSSVSLT